MSFGTGVGQRKLKKPDNVFGGRTGTGSFGYRKAPAPRGLRLLRRFVYVILPLLIIAAIIIWKTLM